MSRELAQVFSQIENFMLQNASYNDMIGESKGVRNMSLSSVLTARRKELDLTLKEIADRVGVSEGTVQRWESGNIKNLRHERIARLADVLDVSPAYLMGWDEKNPPAQVDEGIWETICADSAKLRLVTWIAGLDSETFRRMEKILDAAFDV